MLDILLCVLITALFCNGLKISTGEGMLLECVRVYLDSKLMSWEYTGQKEFNVMKQVFQEEKQLTASKLYYPILYCIKCMPSIYGTAIALLFFPFTAELLFQIPLVVFGSVTLSCVIYQMYE